MPTAVRDTRQVILDAAADLFRRQGYAATTVGQVAEAAGISKGNLTYHFPSKQALFAEANRLAIDFVREYLLARAFAEEPDAPAAMAAFLRRIRRFMLDDDGHFVGCLFTNVAVETCHSDAAVGALARESLAALRDMIVERLEEAQARGEVRGDMPAEVLGRAFFWMYEGALALSKAMDAPDEYDAFTASMPRWLAPQ